MNATRRVAVRGIIFLGGQLLCVKLKPYNTATSGESFWCTPGGGVDTGEALLPALHREIVEELGVSPHIGALLYVQQFMHDGIEHLEFFFHIMNAEDYTILDISTTTHGPIELAEVAFIVPADNHIKPTFLVDEQIGEHIQYAGPVKFFAA